MTESSTDTALTEDNFRAETGFRFRVTNPQKARIELAKLDDAARQRVAAGMSRDELATLFGEKEFRNWMKLVQDEADGWTDERSLTRAGAFQQFLMEGGLEKLRGRKQEVPLTVWLDAELTVETFSDKVEAATGEVRRFRRLKIQKERGLSREQALAEVVAQKRMENTSNE